MARRATIIGSGPNGLAAGVALARAGYTVTVLEASSTVGGGVRTGELTLPGFRHDVGSAVHPAALSSPFFQAFRLRHRIDWVTPEISYAHPLDGGRAGIAWRDIDRTAESLGRDAKAWLAMIRPLSSHLENVVDFTGSQLLRVPRHPLTTLRFGTRVLQMGTALGRRTFATEEADALLTGVFAHANTALPSIGAAASGLFLAAHAHAGDGWAYPRGGAQRIADALIADLRAHGGEVLADHHVRSLSALEWGDAAAGDLLVLDTSPRLLLSHPDIPGAYARAIERYRIVDADDAVLVHEHLFGESTDATHSSHCAPGLGRQRRLGPRAEAGMIGAEGESTCNAVSASATKSCHARHDVVARRYTRDV